MKKRILRGYRVTLYPLFKRLEKTLRSILFALFRTVNPSFHSFRTFGIPAGVFSLLGHEVIVQTPRTRVSPLTWEKEPSHSFFHDTSVVTSGGRVALLPNGFALRTAAHLTEKGELIAEFTQQFTLSSSSIDFHKLFTVRSDRFKMHIPHFKGIVSSLAIDCSNNYYHFLFDALPKIELLRRHGVTPDFYYADTSKPFQREAIKLMGLEDCVLSSNEIPILSASTLALTSFPMMGSFPRWVLDFIRSNFLDKGSKLPPIPRIYISRSRAPCRRVANEEELTPFLQQQGFTIVHTEDLSLADQISLFSQAEVILSPHGAGLTNLAFASPKASVIEFFSPRHTCICYWAISDLLGLKYLYFRGIPDEKLYDPIEGGRDDIKITQEQLEKAFSLACL